MIIIFPYVIFSHFLKYPKSSIYEASRRGSKRAWTVYQPSSWRNPKQFPKDFFHTSDVPFTHALNRGAMLHICVQRKGRIFGRLIFTGYPANEPIIRQYIRYPAKNGSHLFFVHSTVGRKGQFLDKNWIILLLTSQILFWGYGKSMSEVKKALRALWPAHY